MRNLMPTTSAKPLRLAMLGMIPGNGHPYSWSAIVNGFDRTAMAACPYPVIARYLGAQPAGSVGIPGARVTHLWTDNPAEAADVARASLIPEVVAKPEDVIGHVDAVIVSTDDGFDHARRARPFVEAGLPVFVDKPMATDLGELTTFINWRQQGARILSSSGLRYAPELREILDHRAALGDLRWICGVSCKSWERYGIHCLEPILRITGPGFESIRLESRPGLEVAHLQHGSGIQATIPVISDGGAAFGTLQVCGTGGQVSVRMTDTYTAFRAQLLEFITYLRTGQASYPFAHTVELCALLIAGLRSRENDSRRVSLAEITSQLPHTPSL